MKKYVQHFYYFLGAMSSREVNDGVVAAFIIPIALKTVQTWIGMLWKQSYYSEKVKTIFAKLFIFTLHEEDTAPPFSRGVWAFLTPTIYIVKYTLATVMSTIFSCQKCKAFCYSKYLFLKVIVYQAFHFDGFLWNKVHSNVLQLLFLIFFPTLGGNVGAWWLSCGNSGWS